MSSATTVHHRKAGEPLRLVVLISGGGTTLRSLLKRIQAGTLRAQVVHVISSNTEAKGLQYAADAQIPSSILERKSFRSVEAFSEAIFDVCRSAKHDYVVMGGFLKLVRIPSDFENRVLNIHPSLIPSFCGKGFYGRHVHQAVLDHGAKITGCTVHFVDNQYDHGPIILQRAVPVEDDDTAESLALRVFHAECDAYPQALNLLASGRVEVQGTRVRVLRDE